MLENSTGLNLTQQIIHRIGKAIISGEYGDHKPIPSEAILCEQLKVSRSAAREAVKSLAAKGLISSRARQGIKIRPEAEWNLFDKDVLDWIRSSNPPLNLLREFTQLRLAIEPAAAHLAANLQCAEKIQDIGKALERMKQAESGLDDPLESDIAFHLSILDAGENRLFIQLGQIIDSTLRVSIRFTNKRSGVITAPYEEHKKIYDAILNHEPDQAAKSSAALMGKALAVIDAAIQENESA